MNDAQGRRAKEVCQDGTLAVSCLQPDNLVRRRAEAGAGKVAGASVSGNVPELGAARSEHPEGPVLADSDRGVVERAQSAFLRDLPFPPPGRRLLCPFGPSGTALAGLSEVFSAPCDDGDVSWLLAWRWLGGGLPVACSPHGGRGPWDRHRSTTAPPRYRPARGAVAGGDWRRRDGRLAGKHHWDPEPWAQYWKKRLRLDGRVQSAIGKKTIAVSGGLTA